jgi:steroid 5-alpha reductase family enzyme
VSIIPLALVGLGTAVAYVTLIWLLSLVLKNASIIDIFWAPGFAVLTIVYELLSGDGYSGRQVLVLALVIAWASRLGGHILTRNAGHGEDFRYKKWREQSPDTFWWVSLFRVFYLQGALLWIILRPAAGRCPQRQPPSPDRRRLHRRHGLGDRLPPRGDRRLAADALQGGPGQPGRGVERRPLALHASPELLRRRDALVGYFIIAAGTPWGFVTAFAPAIMTFMLVRVSGVALLERSIKKRRPGYEEYIARTSSFIPLPPKRLT